MSAELKGTSQSGIVTAGERPKERDKQSTLFGITWLEIPKIEPLQSKSVTPTMQSALLTLDPGTINMLTSAGMLAPDGRSKTLDAAADG